MNMYYRIATVNDIDALVKLRKAQLVDEGIVPNQDIDNELINFFEKKLNDNSLIEWLRVKDNNIIVTASIIFYDFPPTYTNKIGVKGYITNMYTKPEYRNRGIATLLLNKLMEEAKNRKVEKLCLIASKMGKSVYLKCEFSESNDWLEFNDFRGTKIKINENEKYNAASCIKIFILIELFNQINNGSIKREQELIYKDEHYVNGSGIMRYLTKGIELPVIDIATLMMIISDNVATNILIDFLGIDNINKTIKSIGCNNTKLYSKFKSVKDATFSETTAFDYYLIWKN